MKKAIILRSTDGELANQLWNYTSIYAYCLERGYSLSNPNFYEYGNFFKIPAPNHFIRIFFFLPFTNYTGRKSTFRRKLWKKLYGLYAKIVTLGNRKKKIVSNNKNVLPFYLPPTKENSMLLSLERSGCQIYFDGWLFRNPTGLKKYGGEIREYFKPREDIEKSVESRISFLRNKFKNVIGVHIRQGDYKTWRKGAYYIEQSRVKEIIEEYMTKNNLDIKQTCFLITSDGKIDRKIFRDLNINVSNGNAVYDLFILSKTDVIIGSNGTFGAFSSYYGDKPFIVMQKGPMDWEYYSDKKNYFENKYSTFVNY